MNIKNFSFRLKSGLICSVILLSLTVLIGCSTAPPAEEVEMSQSTSNQVEIQKVAGSILIEVTDQTVKTNEKVDVPVTIKSDSANPISVVTLSISYDSTVMVAEDCIVSSDLTGVCNTGLDGQIRFSGISPEGLESDFVPVTIQFQAIAEAGQSSLVSVDEGTLADPSGVSISGFQINSGEVSVQ